MFCDVTVIYEVMSINYSFRLEDRLESRGAYKQAITKSKERKSKNVCRQTHSFLKVKLDQPKGYASKENHSRTSDI